MIELTLIERQMLDCADTITTEKLQGNCVPSSIELLAESKLRELRRDYPDEWASLGKKVREAGLLV